LKEAVVVSLADGSPTDDGGIAAAALSARAWASAATKKPSPKLNSAALVPAPFM
jgi:hypothetical protein